MLLKPDTFEKVIATILFVWGLLLTYYSYDTIIYLHELNSKLLQSNSSLNISDYRIFKIYHLHFLLALLDIMGGLFLIQNNKIGWRLTLVALFVSSFFYLIPIDRSHKISNSYIELFITVLAMIMLYIITKPVYRNKYLSNKRTWIIVIVLSILLLADRIYFYLSLN